MSQPRFWCHSCAAYIDPTNDFTCPHCNEAFIEEVDDENSQEAENFAQEEEEEEQEPNNFFGLFGNPQLRATGQRGNTFTFTLNNNPNQPQGQGQRPPQMNNLADILNNLLNNMGGQQNPFPQQAQAQAQAQGQNPVHGHPMPLNPFAQLLGLGMPQQNNAGMLFPNLFGNMPVGNGRFNMGDYAFGNLDQVITHIMNTYNGPMGNPPAPKSEIEKLPEITICKDDTSKEDTNSCTVCMEDFSVGDKAIKMPCNHLFHKGCLVPWLELHNSCPVCRHELPSSEGSDNQQSSSGSNSTSTSQTFNGQQ